MSYKRVYLGPHHLLPVISLFCRAAAGARLGGWGYSKPPCFLCESALLHVPMRSRPQQGKPDSNIYRHLHTCAHTQRNRKYREDKIWRCVWSVWTHAWLSGEKGNKYGWVGRVKAAKGVDLIKQGAKSLRDRWTGQQAQTVSALSSALADGGVRQKLCNTSATMEDSGTMRSEKWLLCLWKRVCLLSKWSCLCLKVDCRLVLSLDTGALISVWLCWLSFSSISTVQQEKPCGHTFRWAPGRDRRDMVSTKWQYNSWRQKNLATIWSWLCKNEILSA